MKDRNLVGINNNYMKQKYSDFGGKLELALDGLTISYEFVKRMGVPHKKESLNRSSTLFKYKLNDNLYLTSALGKNFGDVNNLIAQIGVNWGFKTGNENVLL